MARGRLHRWRAVQPQRKQRKRDQTAEVPKALPEPPPEPPKRTPVHHHVMVQETIQVDEDV